MPPFGRKIMKDRGVGRREFLKGAAVAGAASVASAPVILPEAAQAQPAAAAPVGRRLFLPQSRRGRLRRDAGRSHGPGRRAVAQGHRHRHQHLYRPRALQRLGQRRPPLHAGAVESRRAEPGLPASADAGAALSRRHRGDQRPLPQDLWRPHLRPPDRSAARRSAASASRTGQIDLRQRPRRRAPSGPSSIRA